MKKGDENISTFQGIKFVHLVHAAHRVHHNQNSKAIEVPLPLKSRSP